ncbi:hypothetical protein TSUD_311650 [Trifolium subterraneum]|uniref:Uncharacterized protein n=1 Tax=Trifolium subterraneum TaxID=3900 RepID=A0A2Z6MN60_TRISU|nr:hypothetical protein TSUD_311650 [Trifolium subterraneum]
MKLSSKTIKSSNFAAYTSVHEVAAAWFSFSFSSSESPETCFGYFGHRLRDSTQFLESKKDSVKMTLGYKFAPTKEETVKMSCTAQHIAKLQGTVDALPRLTSPLFSNGTC